MNRFRRLRFELVSLVLAVAVLSHGCAKAPPNLSPAATQAFHNTRVVKVLDLIRDTAQDANAQVPPVVSTDSARLVTEWHRSALLIINASSSGWKEAVKTSMDEVFRNLPAAEQRLLAPYFALAKTIFSKVV